MLQRLLAWMQKNERHLGAAVFFFGFITDLLTFTLLDISVVNLLFAAYLGGAMLAVFLNHIVSDKTSASVWRRTLLVLLPLIAQYLLGSLLSGFLIFYTKSSVLSVSWPFIILLALIFLGNEWFRKYRDRLVFLAVLLFFTIYAYAIFALPLFVHALGPLVFLGSTAVSLAVFAAFLFLLVKTGKKQILSSLTPIIGSCLAITIVLVTSYFTGLVPPIPLTLKEGGIYHAVRHEAGNYLLMAEKPRPWFDPRQPEVHVAYGETLYAFTAIFAPIRFSTGVVHTWQRYDKTLKRWVTESRVSFPMAGGRAEGYRGYSEQPSPQPGNWRVMVETPNGQVIGQMQFSVVETATPPQVYEEVH